MTLKSIKEAQEVGNMWFDVSSKTRLTDSMKGNERVEGKRCAQIQSGMGTWEEYPFDTQTLQWPCDINDIKGLHR